jgi:hypothetical protein
VVQARPTCGQAGAGGDPPAGQPDPVPDDRREAQWAGRNVFADYRQGEEGAVRHVVGKSVAVLVKATGGIAALPMPLKASVCAGGSGRAAGAGLLVTAQLSGIADVDIQRRR